MLVRCPKCNFQQPEDQYCANCGVDMNQFKPTLGQNRSSKSGNSLTFQAFAVIAVAVVGSIWYFNQNQNLAPKTTRVTTQRKVITPAAANSEVVNEQVQVTALNDDQRDTLAGIETESSTGTAVPQSAASAGASTSANNPSVRPESRAAQVESSASASGALFTVNYYEIPKALVDFWIQQNSVAHPEMNQSGVSYGLISKDEMKKLSQARMLLSEKKKLNAGENSQLVHTSSAAYQNPQENPSLTVSLTYESLQSDQTVIELEASKRLPAPEKLPTVKINVPKNSAAFILWRNLVNGFQNHPELLQTPPFNFITSPKANSRETELVLVVESYF